jgi:flagellar M-ring protein FliF
MVYQERGKEQLDRIAALVRSAIGFDQKRGDQVEVVNLRFAELPAFPVSEPQGFMSLLQFTKDDLMHAIEQLVMALLGIIVLLLVVRPLVRRIITPDKVGQAALAAALAGGDMQGALAAGASAEELQAGPNHTSKMIDIAQVQGQVHAQSVQKVGEIADKNPTETVSIIRTWLHETAA